MVIFIIILVIISKTLLLSRAEICRVNFRHIRLRLVLVGSNWNTANAMAMIMFWNRNSCTLVRFVKVLGFG